MKPDAGMPIKPSFAVVDDDASVRDATTSLLRSLGFIATGFSSADEFLKSNCIRSTSCLIADIQMPGMTGLALYSQLSASGIRIPTILTTARPDDSIRAQALRVGVSSYLVKPFNEKVLIDCIDSAVSTHGEGFGACTEHGMVTPGARTECALAAGKFEPPCPVCDRPLATALVSEDAPLDPRNAYASNKVAQEFYAGKWARDRRVFAAVHESYGT
jgi:CheY-like chemotaxis protein